MKAGNIKLALGLKERHEAISEFIEKQFLPYKNHNCTARIHSGNAMYEVEIDRDNALELLNKEKRSVEMKLTELGVEL